jgi:hypothetical protein
VQYEPKPDFVPVAVYNEAQAAKRFYNADWEFWVHQVSQDYNKPLAEAEDACIRGLKKVLLQVQLVYGDRVGKWYEDYLDMSSIFTKVSHPIYLPQLGDNTDV